MKFARGKFKDATRNIVVDSRKSIYGEIASKYYDWPNRKLPVPFDIEKDQSDEVNGHELIICSALGIFSDLLVARLMTRVQYFNSVLSIGDKLQSENLA